VGDAVKWHDLKTWPKEFEASLFGSKRHEFRRDDRGFNVGDLLLLREWDPEKGYLMVPEGSHLGDYTGRHALFKVTFITRAPDFGVPEGFCVMSIERKAV